MKTDTKPLDKNDLRNPVVQTFMDDMIETMYDQVGIGLARFRRKHAHIIGRLFNAPEPHSALNAPQQHRARNTRRSAPRDGRRRRAAACRRS